LLDPNIIAKWATFTLDQRVALANLKFQDGKQISVPALRELYRLQRIQPRSTGVTQIITPAMQRAITTQRLAGAGSLRAAIEAKHEIVFIDEAAFTKRSLIN